MPIETELLKKLEIPTIDPSVKKWLTDGSPNSGPLKLSQPTDVVDKIDSCKDFDNDAPDAPFPGLQLCFDRDTPFYLLPESGQIITIHHDELPRIAMSASWNVSDGRAYADKLALEGSAFTLTDLLNLINGLSEWKSLEPGGMSDQARTVQIAHALNWPIQRLLESYQKNIQAFWFLRLDPVILTNLVWVDEKVEKARANPDARKIDLSYCWLLKWPEYLDNSSVKELNLTGNPDLPWDSLSESLGALAQLKKLMVGQNFLGTAATLKKALPHVTIDAAPWFKLELLEEQAKYPDGIRFLDLQDAGIKDVPDEVLLFSDLEAIDLSENPLMNWDRAFDKLAKLPKLKEVRFKNSGLEGLPDSFMGLSHLETVDFTQIHKRDTAKELNFLGKMSRLKQVNLGKFKAIPLECEEPSQADYPLPHMPSLESITFSGGFYQESHLAFYVDWLNTLPNFRSFTMETNYYTLKPLKNLKQLKALQVSGYKMTGIEDVLDAQSELEHLGFSYHLLTPPDEKEKTVYFPKSIREMKKLSSLNIAFTDQSNKATSYQYGGLPDWLPELPLTAFSFISRYRSERCPQNIPDIVYQLTGLKKLYIEINSKNVILKPEIANLSRIEELTLQGYVDMTPELRLPATLKRFSAYSIPGNLAELTCLEELDMNDYLDDKAITALSNLKELRELKAWIDEGFTIPPSLTKLRKLKTNGSLPELEKLESLEISGEIEFPSMLPSLRKLTYNPKGENWLSQLDILAAYPKLRELKLELYDNPKYPSARNLGKLKQLTYLYLASNKNTAKKINSIRKRLPNCLVDFS